VEYDPAVAVLQALERDGVQYAVFGGIAVNIHGLARFTEDLDIFVAPARDNVERLKIALKSVFDDPSIDGISADDLQGEYPAVQYVPPEGAFHIDILTRLGEAFRWEDLETERVPFEGLLVNVVTPRMLYAEALRRRIPLKDE